MLKSISRTVVISAIVACVSSFIASNASAQLELKLPTKNDKIFSDDPSQFYMYTYRTFEGASSRPWSAGRYGFVRNQKRTDAGIVFTKFHEGVDIRPVDRDASGNPLDVVSSILPGTVVYTSNSALASSYGKYVVVVHDQGHGPFFSLYAHLSSVSAKSGQKVKAGSPLGIMGYTGAGINRERSHVHLELTILLSDRFQKWYDLHFTSRNLHGIYNGFNLTGMDVAGLFHAHKANPGITLPEFVSRVEAYFKVAVPNRGQLEIVKRYPWLLKPGSGNNSWEITFSSEGLPTAVVPSGKSVTYPAVTWVKPTNTNHSYHTRDRIIGSGSSAKLSPSGSRYIQLITGDF